MTRPFRAPSMMIGALLSAACAAPTVPAVDAGSDAGLTVPEAPTDCQASPGDGQATVTWRAPVFNGGTPITGYTVTATPGSETASVTSGTSATVMGLQDGTSYTFTVHATNAVGNSPESAASNAIVPGGLPSAPTNVMAAVSDAQVVVTWTAAATDGTHPVTEYLITSMPGSETAYASGTVTSATVGGLVSGRSYSFTVAAANAVGEGPPSSPSNSVTMPFCGTPAANCSRYATCSEVPGSYTCACEPHWMGNGVHCAPADCEAMNGGCDPNADCSTDGGSISCVCPPPHWAGNGMTCTPDDCETENGGCSDDALCSSDGGTVICTCEQGYVGDGQTCLPGCIAAPGLTVLAMNQDNPVGIGLDSRNVYWTNRVDPGELVSMPLCGGTPETMLSGLDVPGDIAVDKANVYVEEVNSGTVLQVPTDGSTPITLATDQAKPYGITVNATTVYWTNGVSGGTVMAAPIGGGDLVTIASNQASPTNVAVDRTNVYWTNFDDGTIGAAPLNGDPTFVLASGQQGPYGIFADGTNVYWATGAGTVQIAATGGTPLTIAPQGGSLLVVDSTTVYVGQQGAGGLILSVPIGGGTVNTLASGQNHPANLAVNAGALFWADFASPDGTIMSLAK